MIERDFYWINPQSVVIPKGKLLLKTRMLASFFSFMRPTSKERFSGADPPSVKESLWAHIGEENSPKNPDSLTSGSTVAYLFLRNLQQISLVVTYKSINN